MTELTIFKKEKPGQIQVNCTEANGYNITEQECHNGKHIQNTQNHNNGTWNEITSCQKAILLMH